MSTEQRLDELETRLSFQDHTVQQLNDALTDQQAQIDRLLIIIEALRQRLDTSGSELQQQTPAEEPPPHY